MTLTPVATAPALAGGAFVLLERFFESHGYSTVALALLLENAGIPVPGETALLFAGFLCFSTGALRLECIIPLAILAAILGDNLGYWIGRRGGRALLDRQQRLFRIPDAVLGRGELLFQRYGALTIFFARFLFGMRIVAGPLAGVLRMDWRDFAIFNVLGATVWVFTIAGAGYVFGSQFERLLHAVHRVNLGLGLVACTVVLLLWLRHRRERGRGHAA